MSEPVRILHVLGKLNMGGAESRIMDLYRNIDRDKIQFDFVVHTTEHCYFDDEVAELGGRIFSVPRFKIYNLLEYKKAWAELLEAHTSSDGNSEFKMIQGHMTSTAAIYLPIAKECGIKKTIAHARSAGVDAGLKGKMTRILRRNLSKKADELFTCSKIAGISVFGNEAVEAGKVRFIPNAIDVKRFAYNEDTALSLRKELGIDDKLVIGHVGRFHYAKNHEYLLRIFRDLCEDISILEGEMADIEPVLLLIGEGPRLREMKALAIELNIADKVMFLGNKSNIYDYYQAFDYFLYPSRYEGLPGTVVEAQAAGLPILMSDEICDEVMVTDLVEAMSIKLPTGDWAEAIMKDINDGRVLLADRNGYDIKMAEAGFDIKEQAHIIEEFYLNDNY